MADGVLKTSIKTFKLDLPATYTRAADPMNPISIVGVFDSPNQDVDPQTGAPVHSTQIYFGIRLADLPAPPDAGDQIIIKSKSYRINEAREDGQGGAELILGEI